MKAKITLSAVAAAALFVQAVPFAFAADESKTVTVVVENTTFSKDEGAKWEGTLIETDVELKDDSTMLSVLIEAVEKEGYEIIAGSSEWGSFITDIGGVGSETKSSELYAGWTTALNDWLTSQGVDAYTVADKTLEAGDIVTLKYTVTWSDVGGMYGDNDTSLKALEFSSGTLDKDFDPNVKEYTLTLKDEESVVVTPTAANKNFQVRTYKNTYLPETDGAEYKRSAAVPVADGDTLYIGVGNPNWPTMNGGDIEETVYTVKIVSDTTERDNEAAATEVEELIDAVGEVTLDSEEAVNKAKAAYGKLTDEQKALVDNYDVLEAAIAKLEELKAQAKGDTAKFEDMFNDTAAALAKTDAVIGNEWKAIGLSRAGKLPEDYKTNIAKALREYAAQTDNGTFNARRSTENSKESVLAAALGIDPEKLAGKDILSPLTVTDYPAIQGINGQIWANIALTGTGKPSIYRDVILAAQLESGAFSFDGKTEDVDITAMAITALALDDSAEAKAAVEKAVKWLSEAQGEDGSYGNCESTAQVIIALSSVGVDAQKDERFIKDGVSLLDGLAAYYLGDGSFAHLEGNKADGLATEQAFLALSAYFRLSNGQTAIYDFRNEKLTADEAAADSQPDDTASSAPADDSKEDGKDSKNPGTGAQTGIMIAAAACLALFAVRKKSR